MLGAKRHAPIMTFAVNDDIDCDWIGMSTHLQCMMCTQSQPMILSVVPLWTTFKLHSMNRTQRNLSV